MSNIMSGLISKSVRFPVELVEYIETQPGKDFSSKLINLVEEYKGGELRREESIQYYEQLLSANRKKLDEQSDTIRSVNRVLTHLQKALVEMNNLPFT